MSSETVFDIVVLGAGPAGAAAAAFAATKGLSVAVMERDVCRPGSTRPEWLHPDAHLLLAQGGVSWADAALGSIDRVRFVDLTAAREAAATLDARIDVVDTERLTADILSGAAAAGATIHEQTPVIAIETRENVVILKTQGGRSLAARLLIAADGCDSLAVSTFRLTSSRSGSRRALRCQAVVALSNVSSASGAGELTWTLTSDDLSGYGYSFEVDRFLVVGLVADEEEPRLRQAFADAVGQWKEAGLLPEGVEIASSRAEIRPVPRGAALEVDTHVAKHSLVIGDAGGYVAAVSHEGLYPAIWSAALAVDVCAAALVATYPQESLAEFDSRWRGAMVEYLRLPNADLRFLLPLVFTNERMAKRFANGVLAGKNT